MESWPVSTGSTPFHHLLAISNFSIFDMADSSIEIVKGLDWYSKVPDSYEFDCIFRFNLNRNMQKT